MLKDKKVYLGIIFSLWLVGCGGGSESSTDKKVTPAENRTTTTNKEYNLWEYMTPTNSHTNRFSLYSNSQTTNYTTKYSVKQNRVIEVNDYASNEKTIYEKLDNKIIVKFEKNDKANGMYELHLTADIGDVITKRSSNCILSKHYDNFTIKDRNFKDVIEIKCGNTPGYYQKGVGEIAQIDDNNQKQVRVLSN